MEGQLNVAEQSCICESDFEDEISRFMFRMLKKRYDKNDWTYLVRMVCCLHNTTVKKMNCCGENPEAFDKQIENAIRLGQKLVLFGSGERAKETYQYLEDGGLSKHVCAFCSNDPKSWGTELYGKEILSVEEIIARWEELSIIIPVGKYSDEMEKQLLNASFPMSHVILADRYVVVRNIAYRDDLEEIFFNPANRFVVYGINEGHFCYLLNCAGIFAITGEQEKKSEQIDTFHEVPEKNRYYICRSNFRKNELLDAGVPESQIIGILNHMDWLQYFDTEVVPLHITGRREIFVDAGSYDLETSRAFLDWCHNECDRIYAFECDHRGIQLCKKQMEKNEALSNMVCFFPKGCWSEKTTLRFSEQLVATSSKVMSLSEVSSGEIVEIETETIDNVLAGSEATFVKMDIEGSELEALKGARKTILKYHPTLAISIYHKPEDIIEIPAYIKSLVPEYRFYIRGYHEDFTEIVLYAVYPQKN